MTLKAPPGLVEVGIAHQILLPSSVTKNPMRRLASVRQ
jgi:hypothetical protein